MCFLSKVSLENVLLDVRELGKGMELIRRECSLHDHSVLKGFLQASDAQLDKLQRDAKTAEVFRQPPANLVGKRSSVKIEIEVSWRCSSQALMTRQCLRTRPCPASLF